MKRLVSTPPLTDSDTLRDIVYFTKSAMGLATREDIDFATDTDIGMLEPMIDYVLDQNLAGTIDQVWDVLETPARDDFMDEIMRLKAHYNVPRPFVVARKLGIDLPISHRSYTMSSASYPSGHAADARFCAYILADAFLTGGSDDDIHRAELFRIANRIAWGRIILGAHSMQDIMEGRRLADDYFREK